MKTSANNQIFTAFEAKCSHEECPGRIKFDEAHSAGLKVGDTMIFQSSEPSYGRCPICKRHKMVITKGPPPPKPQPPKGFTKNPTE
jgi:hypothetical protein